MKRFFYIYAFVLVSFCVNAQTEVCNSSQKPDDEKPITLKELVKLRNSSNFYNPNYRYLDDLGGRGGKYSAGILDTWLGQTQIQFPYNGLNVKVNSTNSKLVANNSNYLYWMTLAMGQEYMNVDMQWMMGFGAKETFSGTINAGPPFNTNTEGAYGPFEVEQYTGVDRAIAYPTFFPKYEGKLSVARDINTSGIVVKDFMDDYTGADKTELDDAKVVNAYILSVVNLLSIYNLFSYAKDLCWNKIIANSSDPYYALGAVAVTYNLGVFGADVVTTTMTKDNYKATIANPLARDLLPQGNSFYRKHITKVVQTVVKKAEESVTDKSISLWDYQISWKMVERFFMGEGGKVNKQGEGGLLRHFVATDIAKRQKIMGTLKKAFDLLKGKAPSTTSTNKISFRYDWLTLLRTVKQHFPNGVLFSKPKGGDVLRRIKAHSAIGGCCNKPEKEIEIEINQNCLMSPTTFKVTKKAGVVNWSVKNSSGLVIYKITGLQGSYIFKTEGSYTIEANVDSGASVVSKKITFESLPTVKPITEYVYIGKDKNYAFDLSSKITEILKDQDPKKTEVSFHHTKVDATLQVKHIKNTKKYTFTGNAEELFVRISKGACFVIGILNLRKDKLSPTLKFTIPKFFTPNGDGINDTWKIIDPLNILQGNSKIYIFDRYGKLLASLSALGNGWDGTYLGKKMPPTGYWYHIEYSQGGVSKQKKGNFSLH